MRSVVLLLVLAAACGHPPAQPGTRGEPLRNDVTPHAPTGRASTPGPVVLATRSFWPSNFIADSSGLYWTESGPDGGDVLFLPVPTNGASPRSVLHVNDASIGALALGESSLFVTVSRGGQATLYRRDKRGEVTTIATEVFIKHLVYRDEALYADSGGGITRYGLDGSTPVQLGLVHDARSFEYFDVGERHVVFSYLPTTGAHTAPTTRLARVATTGGNVEVVIGEYGGLWTLDGASIITSLDDGKLGVLATVGPDTTKPVVIPTASGVSSTPLGVSGDKLLVRNMVKRDSDLLEQLQVRSLTTGDSSPPVPLSDWSTMTFSDGALWYTRLSQDADGNDIHTLLMFVP